jgi:hypothetical protein
MTPPYFFQVLCLKISTVVSLTILITCVFGFEVSGSSLIDVAPIKNINRKTDRKKYRNSFMTPPYCLTTVDSAEQCFGHCLIDLLMKVRAFILTLIQEVEELGDLILPEYYCNCSLFTSIDTGLRHNGFRFLWFVKDGHLFKINVLTKACTTERFDSLIMGTMPVVVGIGEDYPVD